MAPASKSYTIRGLMCAALAAGESRVVNPLTADDSLAAAGVLAQAGIDIDKEDGCWRVKGGGFRQPQADLYCRDSAATLRFMTAIASLIPGRCRLTMGQSLSRRPLLPLLDALAQLDVCCYLDGDAIVVDSEKIKGGEVTLSGSISSQFISALLLVAPRAEKDVTIYLTTPPQSRPYLEMTLDCMRDFGVEVEVSADWKRFNIHCQVYHTTNYSVEGDWSSASYFLALGALTGRVEIAGLEADSLQADRIMLNLLRQMGACIDVGDDAISVSRSLLKAITADLSDGIDLLPTVAILAAAAEGESRLNGIGRARLKESNRVTVVKDGLERMGVAVTEEPDSMIIHGTQPQGAVIDSYGDHRIAMAFGTLGAVIGDTTIEDAGCVNKTYPGFWQSLQSLGGEVSLDV
jgi:3-phosphoshikimate 1-carboxyvinyltransferase